MKPPLRLITFTFLLVCCRPIFSFGQYAVKTSNIDACNNWLSLPSTVSYVTIGDLDISGNQLTIEANFNRTMPYSGNQLYAGDLVSKHKDFTDANYILRPNTAEVTTTNGYFKTPEICDIQLNKTYHAAMVYDGTSLKFYRNGFLMSQVPCSGNLFLNDYITTIGAHAANVNVIPDEHFLGYINEVRIWNVARTQTQIQTYLNSSLPTPTMQPGLLAYYIFDNPANKQGNTIWNGTVGGNGTIMAANPNCTFIADSCNIPATGTIINSYTPVLGFNPCDNKIIVEDASTFNPGDTVLMIQMKGAVIDSSNTSAFGSVTDYKNAGNYEFNYVKSKSGNIIELKNKLTRQYDIPDGKVQLIRVPYYDNLIISSTLTCLPWDGSKGGVLALNVKNIVNMQADMDVSGKGFRGGKVINTAQDTADCDYTDYFFSNTSIHGAPKGESIISTIDSIFGKGALASAGGGGNGHNSGGGGGGNGTLGGYGGYQYSGCSLPPFDNRGLGGLPLTYNNIFNKIFLAGGGGAGHCNNSFINPAAASDLNYSGGNGGGIIIMITNSLQGNNHNIISKGDSAFSNTNSGPEAHDGRGGGGAGGTILINSNNFINNVNVNTTGGKGCDLNTPAVYQKVGPGGGGSGGIVWLKQNSIPAYVTIINDGGANGHVLYDNSTWGTTPGDNGLNIFNLIIPVDNISFKPNIDSLKIINTPTSCSGFDFKGLGYTNTNPINNWQWNFGDGGTATTQNSNHTYIAGTYPVKLVATDINGCKDSSSINVTTSVLSVDAGPDSTICTNIPVTLQGNSTGGTMFTWSPSQFLNDNSVLNPIATVNSTTKFYLQGSNALGCTQKDSVTITVRPLSSFTINNPISICNNNSTQLSAAGGNLYSWQPAASLSNPSIANPNATPQTTTTYTVQITDTVCNNTSTLSTLVTILPPPIVKASKSNDIDCSNDQSQLTATGGVQYSWSPVSTLNNAAIPNPIAKPTGTIKYVVKGTDQLGCINYDSVTVKVVSVNNGGYLMPSAFTPNNDGLNDCYGIRYWGLIKEVEFSIYNRWGQLIFYTNKPGQCWDGKYKGVKQDPNVFVYMIKAKTNCENYIFRKGTFMLIR